jgi:Gpi18-like mannosyltransferase
LWSWLGSRLLFLLTLALSMRPHTAAELVDRLGQWDGAHYLRIVAQGYSGDEFAFFPLFPYTTKAVATLFHTTPLLAALLLVNGAFLGGLLVLHRLSERWLGTAVARNVVLLTCLNPMAIFFAIPYTESFYLLFTALALAALLPRRTGPLGGLGVLAAGLFGGLAAATRPTGVVLVATVVCRPFIVWRDAMGEIQVQGQIALNLLLSPLCIISSNCVLPQNPDIPPHPPPHPLPPLNALYS